ncbi:hypothetical protein NQ314_021380 [Rhamnusium bicolor]|uniref:PiggyBac transposable element-derived protein domain-containing protein n=1 Tax=Rhamnusium bicolor TaxID=1586634 RepID=A0AAV8WHV1_9CUCU|nr:hypothetical protein NQ314_021380 [Rhamnusium bicolor]
MANGIATEEMEAEDALDPFAPTDDSGDPEYTPNSEKSKNNKKLTDLFQVNTGKPDNTSHSDSDSVDTVDGDGSLSYDESSSAMIRINEASPYQLSLRSSSESALFDGTFFVILNRGENSAISAQCQKCPNKRVTSKSDIKPKKTQDKILATITDNGSNFVKAFKEYGIHLETCLLINSIPSSQVDETDDNEDNKSHDYTDLDDIIFQPAGVMEMEDEQHEQHIQLPNHFRCATHTLNLIATTDIMNSMPTIEMAIIATTLIPKFRLRWLHSFRNTSLILQVSQVKNMVINAAKEFVSAQNYIAPEAKNDQCEVDDFFELTAMTEASEQDEPQNVALNEFELQTRISPKDKKIKLLLSNQRLRNRIAKKNLEINILKEKYSHAQSPDVILRAQGRDAHIKIHIMPSRPLTDKELQDIANNLFVENNEANDFGNVYSSGESNIEDPVDDLLDIEQNIEQASDGNASENGEDDYPDGGEETIPPESSFDGQHDPEYEIKYKPDKFDETKTGCNVADINASSKQLAYFELYFTKKFVETIVKECNRQMSYLKESDANFKLSIDESLVLFKGRLAFRQYIPSKRHRFGIKLFMLCDSKTRVCLDFIIYTGATTELVALPKERKEIGKSGQIEDTYVCGTIRTTRKFMPVFHEKLQKGEMTFRSSGPILILKWCDEREIHMVTTMHDFQMSATKKKDSRTGRIIMKPTCVINYNFNMGGIDQTDILISSIESVHMVTINCLALYNYIHDRKSSVADFQLELTQQIFEKYADPEAPTTLPRHSQCEHPLRLLAKHFIRRVPKPTPSSRQPVRRCVVCAKNKKRSETTYQCDICNLPRGKLMVKMAPNNNTTEQEQQTGYKNEIQNTERPKVVVELLNNYSESEVGQAIVHLTTEIINKNTQQHHSSRSGDMIYQDKSPNCNSLSAITSATQDLEKCLLNNANQDTDDEDNPYESSSDDFVPSTDEENLYSTESENLIDDENYYSREDKNMVEISDETSKRDVLSAMIDETTQKNHVIENDNVIENNNIENNKDNENNITNDAIEHDDIENDNNVAFQKEELKVRKIKRKPDSKYWTKEENKAKREKGEKYLGFKKNEKGKWIADQERDSRHIKPFCNCKKSMKPTKIQCRKFSEEERLRIFTHFWSELSWAQRKIYVNSLVDSAPPKDKKKSS